MDSIFLFSFLHYEVKKWLIVEECDISRNDNFFNLMKTNGLFQSLDCLDDEKIINNWPMERHANNNSSISNLIKKMK